ncbi:hypothetical protein GE061_017583 [Apolygus lucorum]|uniref:Uncharacterized protein n=1 Tax=Apolygus lucorum TaxID=248454 RepID=A0A8S9XB90_APOLU|nr:hypothetical protein GE061_017583 [Apolygus lucorum]
MIVRGVLRLTCIPFSVGLNSMVSNGWKNRTFIALGAVSNLIELTLFGWLIYGTIVVSKIWPGSDKDDCDKPCYLTAFSSIVIDWIWKLLITFAVLFPLCWFATEQWTTAMFVMYIGAKKGRKTPHDNPSVQPA